MGAIWVSEKDIFVDDNALLLVLRAFQWLRTNNLGVDDEVYKIGWYCIKLNILLF